MAVDVGTARVLITGDYSKLAADFAAAQGIASTGSRAIGSSVSSAFEQSSLTVDQFGRAIRSSTEAVVAAAPPVLDLTAGIQRLALAQVILKNAIDEANNSAGHQVSQLQAVSGAIRVGLGEQSIRAAERFASLIPGLGTALQYAFPVIGAVALGGAIAHVASEATGLKAAEAELARQTAATDAAFDKAARSIQRVNVELQTMQFSGSAGKHLEAFYSDLNASADLDKIEELKQKIREVAELKGNIANNPMLLMPYFGSQAGQAAIDQIKALGAQIAAVERDNAAHRKDTELIEAEGRRAAAEEAGSLLSQRVANEQAANTRFTALDKSRADAAIAADHAAETQRIAGLDSEYARVVQIGAEDVKNAQKRQYQSNGNALATRDTSIQNINRRAGADSQGKSQEEAALIQARALGEVQAAQDAYTAATLTSQNEVDAAVQKGALAIVELNRKVAQSLDNQVTEGWDKVTEASRSTMATVKKAVETQIVGFAKVEEIQAKSAGAVAQVNIEHQKLELERQYGLEVGETLAQQISYMQDLAAADDKAREARVDGLKAELAIAETIDDQVARKLKVAEIQAQINELEAQGRNASYAAQTKIDETQHSQDLGNKLGADASRAPAAVGGALAKGLIDGKGIGRDIRESLSGIGKQMLGDVFTKAIEQMVIAITGNTIATNLNTIWTELQALIPHPFGFASGGRPSPGIPYVVGENGPELRIDDGPGTIIPSGMYTLPSTRSGSAPIGAPTGSSNITNSSRISSSSMQFGDMHFHGIQNVQQLMAKIADVAKNGSSSNAAYNK